MNKVMFLCTGNSCRSQMAEGLLRVLGKGRFEVYSAGLRPIGVNRYANKAMAEIGIDITGQTSDPIDPELLGTMDYAITLCGNAEASCPVTPPEVTHIHWPVDDPYYASGTEEDIMAEFRRVREDIQARIERFMADVP